MECSNCKKEINHHARFCSKCGTVLKDISQPEKIEREPDLNQIQAAQIEETAASISEKSNDFFSSPKKVLGIIGAIFALLLVISLASGGGAQSPYDSNGVTLDKFGCSFGTTTASAIVKNNTDEALNAFVTVGLYGDGGTLQWSGTEWGMVEPGGKRLINVKLGGYQFTRGECKIINIGY